MGGNSLVTIQIMGDNSKKNGCSASRTKKDFYIREKGSFT